MDWLLSLIQLVIYMKVSQMINLKDKDSVDTYLNKGYILLVGGIQIIFVVTPELWVKTRRCRKDGGIRES